MVRAREGTQWRAEDRGFVLVEMHGLRLLLIMGKQMKRERVNLRLKQGDLDQSCPGEVCFRKTHLHWRTFPSYLSKVSLRASHMIGNNSPRFFER